MEESLWNLDQWTIFIELLYKYDEIKIINAEKI